MSLDSSKISIITSTKVNPKKLVAGGDTASNIPEQVKLAHKAERRCNGCCMAFGCAVSIVMVFMISCTATAITINAEKRVNYTMNGFMRHAAWLSIPGIVVGTTLHYFLSEAMWSNKRNSWGQAWSKAFLFNTLVWCTGIGASTAAWRKLLPLSAAGRRFYYRYPISDEPLEVRLLRREQEFFTGMGWSYWLSGVGTGQMGFVICSSFCVWANRPYMMMSPAGGYARRCMPPWRREQFANLANVPYGVVEEKMPK